jgi:cold shock CspA family protein
MRELGWIKWFGGRNSRTGKENDYGFIERPGDSSIFVHPSEVKTSLTNLLEGVAVTFDLYDFTMSIVHSSLRPRRRSR